MSRHLMVLRKYTPPSGGMSARWVASHLAGEASLKDMFQPIAGSCEAAGIVVYEIQDGDSLPKPKTHKNYAAMLIRTPTPQEMTLYAQEGAEGLEKYWDTPTAPPEAAESKDALVEQPTAQQAPTQQPSVEKTPLPAQEAHDGPAQLVDEGETAPLEPVDVSEIIKRYEDKGMPAVWTPIVIYMAKKTNQSVDEIRNGLRAEGHPVRKGSLENHLKGMGKEGDLFEVEPGIWTLD